jgi:ABC-type branched-subunit amino acid transport system substrate-binding protein
MRLLVICCAGACPTNTQATSSTINRCAWLTYKPMDDAVAGAATGEKGVQNVKRMIGDASVLGMIGPYQSAQAAVEIPVANAMDLVMLRFLAHSDLSDAGLS